MLAKPIVFNDHRRLFSFVCVLLLLLMLIPNMSVSAETNLTKITVEKKIEANIKNNARIEKARLEGIVRSLCSAVLTAKGSLHKDAIRNVGYEIETRLLISFKVTKSHKNHEKIITDFWNENQNSFICKANTHYGEKHLFKVVIDMQMYTPVLLDYFFQEDRKQLFEVNAYEIVNGKPETLLDYLVDIKMGFNNSQSYNIPEINALIEIIEDEYGALRGKDLVIIPK